MKIYDFNGKKMFAEKESMKQDAKREFLRLTLPQGCKSTA